MYNRHREQQNLAPNFLAPVYNQANAVIGSSWALRVGTRKWCDDVVTPGFHKRKKRGEIFCNPYHIEDISYTFGPGTGNAYHHRDRPWERWWAGPEMFLVWIRMAYCPPNVDQWPLAFAFSETEAEDFLIEASTRVHSERGRNEANLWEALAEIDKTMGTLNSIRTQVHSIAGAFNKTASAAFKAHKRWRATQACANLYLQYRYGIAPLVSDASKVMLALKSQLRGLRLRQTTRAKEEAGSNRIITRPFASGPCAATVNIEVSDKLLARAGSMDVGDVSLQQDLGLGGKDLLTLPWELVPYSFVVDWFVNVGDVLGSLVPSPHLQQLCSWCSVERTVKHVVTVQNCRMTDAQYIQERPCTGRFEAEWRIKARGPLRDPRLKIKHDFGFGRLTRIGDAWALTTQLVRSNYQYSPKMVTRWSNFSKAGVNPL